MKKATLSAVYTALNDTFGWFDNGAHAEVREELEKELTRGDARKEANAKAYDALHDVVIDNLSDTPCTSAELWEAIKDDVPEGTTKNKVQYALAHLWQDEIVKIDGKPNTYRKA